MDQIKYNECTVTENNRASLFDDWANHYDDSVPKENDFPFAGYDSALDALVGLANPQPKMRILDLGTGTGNLAQRFIDRGCTVWGVDFSAEMLSKAKAKLQGLHTLQADLLSEGWPQTWPLDFRKPFDCIVSAYVLHEFPLNQKIDILLRAARTCLVPGGKIILADIAFLNKNALAKAQAQMSNWDPDEHYWAAEQACAACAQAGLNWTYQQVSICAGIFTFSLV